MNKSKSKETLQHYLNQTIYKVLGQALSTFCNLTDFHKKTSKLNLLKTKQLAE